MVREWRILTALEGTPVPHPTPRLLCEELAVIGAPFMLMDVVDGFTPGFELVAPFVDDPSLRFDLGMAYVEGCAASGAGRLARRAGSTGWAGPRGSSSARCRAGSPSSTATALATCPNSTSSPVGSTPTGRR